MFSRISCSNTFPGTKVRSSSLQFHVFYFLPFLKTRVTLSFFQSSATWRKPKEEPWERHHLMSAAAKVTLTFTLPHNSSLSVNIRSTRASPLISSMITSVRKSSSMYSRKLDCLCPTMLPYQQKSQCLKFPMRIQACEHEVYSSCLKKASSTSS